MMKNSNSTLEQWISPGVMETNPIVTEAHSGAINTLEPLTLWSHVAHKGAMEAHPGAVGFSLKPWRITTETRKLTLDPWRHIDPWKLTLDPWRINLEP
jgi:hypothetical protein